MFEFIEKNWAHTALRQLCEKYAKKDHVAYDMGCGLNIFPSIVLTDYVARVYAVDNKEYKLLEFGERLRKELNGKVLPIETIHADIDGFKSDNGTVTACLDYEPVKTGLPKADVVLFHRPTFLDVSKSAFKRGYQLMKFKSGVKSMHQLMKPEGYLLILGWQLDFYELWKDELKGFSEVEKDLRPIPDEYLIMQKIR